MIRTGPAIPWGSQKQKMINKSIRSTGDALIWVKFPVAQMHPLFLPHCPIDVHITVWRLSIHGSQFVVDINKNDKKLV